MPWVKLDDAILDNPKILEAGPLGFALHVAAICYCARNLTDGFLPTPKAASLLDLSGVHCDHANPCGRAAYGRPTGMSGGVVDVADVIEMLVELGLWHRVDGGFEVHDFLEYNPSRAKVEADRQQAKEQRSEAGKASAAKRRERQGQREFNGNPTSGQRTVNETRTGTERKSNPDPDPDPDPDPEPQKITRPVQRRDECGTADEPRDLGDVPVATARAHVAPLAVVRASTTSEVPHVRGRSKTGGEP